LLDNLPLPSVSGTFTALSYCAGDPRNATRILVNGQHFNVFANLAVALEECHTYWGKKWMTPGEQLLWVDQVCINQSDSRERSHQVALMRAIYAGAERVLVCLNERRGPYRSLEHIKEVQNKLRKSLSPRKVGSESQFEQAFGGFALGPVDGSWATDRLSAFNGLGHSSWWGRCWICQEFTVARKADFLYMKDFMTWEDFAILLCYFIETSHADRRIVQFNRMESLIVRKVEWNQAGGQQAGELKSWLNHGLTCESSDPRDKVFAFLGLVSDEYNITPDYSSSKSMRQMLVEIATRIIAVDKNLDILRYKDRTISNVGNPKVPDLPSWVPDWTCQLQRTRGTPVHSKSFSSRIPTVKDNRKLIVEGFNLDDLKSDLRKFMQKNFQGAAWYFPPTSAVFSLKKEDPYWVFKEEIEYEHIPWQKNTEWKILHCVQRGEVDWFLDQGLEKKVIEIN
jgi:hypothetical protein